MQPQVSGFAIEETLKHIDLSALISMHSCVPISSDIDPV
jgi:hypothetical protein